MRSVQSGSRRGLAFAVAATVIGMGSVALALPTVDGTRDAEYGPALAVQTVNTQFGNNQSELDAVYANITGSRLSVFFAGNIESNYNKIVVFFDTKAGGQNTILESSPIQDNYAGLKFDADFSPDYSMILNRGDGDNSFYVDFSELPTAGGGFGGYAGKITVPGPSSGLPQVGAGFLAEGQAGMPQIELGYDDANLAGVDGGDDAADPVAAAAVTTGTEFALDLSSLGITGSFKLMAFINGSGHDFASNQFLPGLPAPQGNLGNDGMGRLSNVDLTAFAGDQFVTIDYVAAVTAWNTAGDGNWSDPGNWTAGVPDGPTAQALLAGPAGAGGRVVSLDAAPVTLQQLTFDNASVGYTVAGPQTLTFNASPLIPTVRVLSGSHTISAPVTFQNVIRMDVAAGSSLALTGPVSAAGLDLFMSGGGSFSLPATTLNSITVNGGAVSLTGADNTVVRGVQVDEGSSLDIGASALIVDYDEGFSPLDRMLGDIAGGWLGSTVVSNSNRAIGYLDSADLPSLTSFGATALDPTALVFLATLKGDSNLDRTVDFNDLLALAQNYNTAEGAKWFQGDSNHDGAVDFNDLLALAQNYNGSLSAVEAAALGADVAADWALAQSLVPEPVSLSALAAGLLMIRRRR